MITPNLLIRKCHPSLWALIFLFSLPTLSNAQVANCMVNFTYSISNTPPAVQFHAVISTTNSPATFVWDFGDGNSGSTQNPAHTYAAPGNYLVCVTATMMNSAGVACTATHCDTVRIGTAPACDAHFAVQQTSVNGTIQFNPAPNPVGTQYQWDFGDGATSSAQNPIHSYTQVGTYLVCLTVSSGSGTTALCTATWCNNVTVGTTQTLCDARFAFTSVSASGGYQFSPAQNTQYTTYAWDFGDGFTSNLMNPFHAYTAPGAYQVCLTVTNTPPFGPACTATHCDTVRYLTNVNCNAHFTYQHSATGTTQFQSAPNTNTTTYSWDFGDGSNSSLPNPSHQYNQSGTYWVCLTVTSGTSAGTVLCTSTWCDSVTFQAVTPHCNAQFTTQQATLINGVRFIPVAGLNTTTQFAWDFGDGTISTQPSPIHSYPAPGVYFACLTVTQIGPNGILCTAQWCDSVHVGIAANCSAYFTARRDSALRDVFHFSANNNSPNTTYTWDFGDGSTGSGQHVSHQYAHSGRYTVCLTVTSINSSGQVCTDHYCRVIGIRNTMFFQCHARFVYRQVPGAVNTLAFFSRNWGGNNSYSWDFGDGSTSTDQNPVHMYADTGFYQVCMIVFNPNANCSDTVCRMVYVSNHPMNAALNDHSTEQLKYTQQNLVDGKVVIYPNPLSQHARLIIPETDSPISFRLFDTNGRVVLELSRLENGVYELPVSDFPKGIYFYQATDESGKRVNSGKVIVQ